MPLQRKVDVFVNDELESTIKVAQGAFVVGSHDSIILLGAKPQSALRECSKSVSKILLESSIDLDVTISDVVYEIKQFQENSKLSTNPAFIKKRLTHQKLLKKFNYILNLLDNVSLYLKLQQAQLLKEIKMLESLKCVIEDSKNELEDCLNLALEKLSNNKRQVVDQNNCSSFNEQNLSLWYLRLERRIEDLKISHAVSVQSQTQINMLINNNHVLIDKIVATITNTIPIWQNQISLLLGIELLESRNDVQEKVLKITNACIEKNAKAKKRSLSGKTENINIEKMLSVNQHLQSVLTELEKIEKDDIDLRNTLKKYLFIER